MPLIELADFNRDSMIDIAFFTPEGTVTVLYNQYTAQGPTSENLCNPATQTSMLYSKEMFAYYPFTQSQNVLVQKITSPKKELTMIGISPSTVPFTTSQGTDVPALPGRLRLADLD